MSIRSPEQEDPTPPPPWEHVASESRNEYSVFRTRRDRVRSPTDGEEREFDVIDAPDAVTVVAVTEDGDLVAVEQFRHGTRQVVLEFPGGVIDEGESALECGPRELLEETGYAGGEAELLGTLTLNSSYQSTRIHIVRVRDVRRTGEKDLDESEDTRVRIASASDLLQATREGRFDTAVAIAALALHLWDGNGAGDGDPDPPPSR